MSFTPISILDPVSGEGLWWLPAKPLEKLAGRLYQEEEKFFLDIYTEGNLGAPLEKCPKEVHGTIPGHILTLLEVVSVGGLQTSAGFKKAKFAVRYVLTRCHITAKTPIKEITVELSEMDVSLGASLISETSSDSGERTYETKAAEEKCILLPALGAELRIVNWVQHSEFGNNVLLREVVDFHFRRAKGETLDWYVEKVYHLRNLLTVLHGQMCIFLKITVATDDTNYIEVFFNQDRKQCQIETKSPLFIPLRLLSDDELKSVIRLWFEDWQQKMIPVFLLCRTIYDGSNHNKTDLIIFCQALEAFHRLFVGGEYMKKSDYQPFFESMLESIPEEFSNSLRSRITSALQFGYQFSQRKRLTELMKRLPAKVKESLTSEPGIFVERVLDTRNFMTHSDEFSSLNIIPDEDLSIVNFGMATWLHCLIVQGLKVPEELIENRLTSLSCYTDYRRFKGSTLFSKATQTAENGKKKIGT